MSEKITMADILTPIEQYVHVPFWYSIRQAMAALSKSPKTEGCTSPERVVLVFDSAYNLVGAVRRLNLLRGLEPSFLQTESGGRATPSRTAFTVKDDVSLSIVGEEHSAENMKRQSERPIGEVMSPIEVTLEADDSIIKGVFKMAKVTVGVVPVLKDDSVVGIVTVDELFKAVSNFVL
jgi:CBS domain-containing protein